MNLGSKVRKLEGITQKEHLMKDSSTGMYIFHQYIIPGGIISFMVVGIFSAIMRDNFSRYLAWTIMTVAMTIYILIVQTFMAKPTIVIDVHRLGFIYRGKEVLYSQIKQIKKGVEFSKAVSGLLNVSKNLENVYPASRGSNRAIEQMKKVSLTIYLNNGEFVTIKFFFSNINKAQQKLFFDTLEKNNISRDFM